MDRDRKLSHLHGNQLTRRASDEALLRELEAHYRRVARAKFESRIPLDYRIVLNPRLRRLTGRITYRQRLIEISTFHTASYGLDDARATLEHELLHLYLHELGLPSGHTPRFKELARAKGIRVFHANPYPRNRQTPWRYLYECGACRRLVYRTRPTGHRLACGPCCRAHTSGRWDPKFALRLLQRVRMV